MTDARDDRRRWTTGTLLIALGLLLLAGRLDDVFDWEFRGYWPLALIALGVVRFWVTKDDPQRGGFWLVTVGTILFLHTQHVLRLHESWPLFVVAAGVAILLKEWGGSRPTGHGGR